MNDFLKNIFVWLVLGSIIFFVFNSVEPTSPRETISYSQFKQEVLSDRVAEVTYKGDQMTIFGQRLDGSKFKTNHPIYKSDPVLDAALQDNGVITSYEEVQQPSLQRPQLLLLLQPAVRGEARSVLVAPLGCVFGGVLFLCDGLPRSIVV